MIYSVRLRSKGRVEDKEWVDGYSFYILVQAKDMGGVMTKVEENYPNHTVIEVGETIYTAVL